MDKKNKKVKTLNKFMNKKLLKQNNRIKNN